MTLSEFKIALSEKQQALAVYADMLCVRLCEEAVRREYPKDQIRTPVHLCNGTEAIAAGTLRTLPAGSSVYGTYRNHGLYVIQTGDIDGFFAEMFGKGTGVAKGKSGSMHLANPERGLMFTSAVVATTIPLAAGTALARQYRGEDALTAVYFGDGAMEEGAFWETLNFACLKKLRLLFICEDNQLAIHTHARDRQGFKSVPEALCGFPVAVESGSGCHPRDVMALTRKALGRMRAQGGPGFLHLMYHRQLEHVGVHEDYAAGYRETPVEADRCRTDPILQAEEWLRELGASAAELAAVRSEAECQVESSVARAQRDDFPHARELHTDVYA